MSTRTKIIHALRTCCLGLALGFSTVGVAGDGPHAGLLFDQFPLTLDSGCRIEAVGPFFYSQHKYAERTWAFPPLLSYDTNPAIDSGELDFIYPLMTYERYGTEYRWQFGQLLSFAGGQNQEDSRARRFTLYPFYFQQRSPDTNENYTAFIPFYGHLKHRLMRDEIFFVLFPFYSETRKRDVITDNYIYPFFHLRHGDSLHGWQLWPLAGAEHKGVTTRTNGFDETESIGGHARFFALWPVYFRQDNGIGTDNPEKVRAALPFYSLSRSPHRDSTSVLWPFFTWIDDREKKYHEWDGPYPFVAIARGEGKTTTRFFPLFSRAHNDAFESDFYLWPLYKYNRLHTAALDRRRTRIMFYLFANIAEKNMETGAERRRVDLWPLFTYHRSFTGNSRLQVLAPIEPMVPDNRGIERNWSPLWSLWRSENNPKTGAASQSLFWNLYRLDTAPACKKCSLLFGLFQYQSSGECGRLRLFYVPVSWTHQPAGQSAK